LQNAIVKVENTTYSATTDSLGNYLISNLPDGNYKIIAQKYGYVAKLFTAIVVAGNSITKNVNLRAEFLLLEAVKISGNKNKSINLIDKIDL